MSIKRDSALQKGLIFGLLLTGCLFAPMVAQAQGTFFIEGNKVGIGIAVPARTLHLFSSDGSASLFVQETSAVAAERVLFRLQNKGKLRFVLENTAAGATWTFDNDGNFTISKVGTGVNELLVDGSGNMIIQGTLTENSDFFAKENFVSVNAGEILQRVLALPISRWNYKDDGGSITHLGPMAQDFYQLFELGRGETGISPLDTNGVALAAIQGLHELLEVRDREIANLKEELTKLRELVESLAAKQP